MKSIYMRNLLTEIWNKKKITGVFIVVFALIFGVLGVKKADQPTIPEEQIVSEQEYEASLQNYDDSIVELEKSVSEMKEQISQLEQYCNDSIYMKLDSLQIQTAVIQFEIQADEGKGEDDILNAWTSYINDGSLKEGVSENLQEIPAEYLKEIISCSVSGDVLTIFVMHYDMEQAENIIQEIEAQVEKHKDSIENVHGEFSLQKLDEAQYVKADVEVLNNQNVSFTNLKNYRTSLSELEKKLVDQQTARSYYAEGYKPEEVKSVSRSKVILEYIVLGIIFGIMIPAAVYTLRYIMSDRLKGKEELLYAGIPVLGTYNCKKGYLPTVERSVMDIKLLAEKMGSERLFMSLLGEDKNLEKVKEDYKEKLHDQNISVLSGNAVMEDAAQLQEMVNSGNCVLIVELGKTTYSQMEEQIQLCQKFNISIWGSIVIA